MNEFILFALLGVGVGGLYAFAAQGLVLVYRGSGVLNFAHGAIGISGAYLWWELHVNHGQSQAVSFGAGVLFAAAIGALMHLVLMRRLRTSSPLVRVVATLGVLILLQGIATNRYGADIQSATTMLPQGVWDLGGGIIVTSDRIYLLLIAAAVTAALWATYRYTRFGLATSAVAENQRAAATLGWSRDVIATSNWALGSALAAAAAILMAQITALSVLAMTKLLLVTLAAALVGNFSSFALTFLGGLAIGVTETVLSFYSIGWGNSAIGLPSAVPFFIIIALLVLRGRALPLRDFFLQRHPTTGSGRVRPGLLLLLTGLGIFGIYRLDANWAGSLTTTFTVALILLSIVVVTGYAGQISLAQFAIAAFGAWIAGRLVDALAVPFWAAVIVGVAGTVPLGLLFALPAVRTRGINLAIVTLGLGAGLEYMLFQNADYTGGYFGTVIGETKLFGWDVYAVTHPQRYASVCLVALVLSCVVAANVRRGRVGRRLLAVRTNERAAAALGISVVSAKLYAFGLAAAIAALGGILMLFRTSSITFADITNSHSILLVGLAVIGGIGYLLGPLLGAFLAAGALGTQITNSLFSEHVSSWLQVFAGGFLLLLILHQPDGLARAQVAQAAWLGERLSPLAARLRPAALDKLRRRRRRAVLPTERRERVRPQTLEVRDVTVTFGAVVACENVSLTVEPGQIVGLIGPNGAGKTTLVDAITGFVKPSSGQILLDGRNVTGWSAVRRSRAGLSRSFQSLELFEDMTVLDNLRTASEPRDVRSYITDLIYPATPPLPGAVVSAIGEFNLEEDLDRQVPDLPFGARRLLAMGRAVATQPSILLLDECAAGLSEEETRELAHVVRRLAREWGAGILVIEHDVNFVMSICDHVVVLDFGRTISEGPPEVVRRDEQVIAVYLGEAEEAPSAPVVGVAQGRAGR